MNDIDELLRMIDVPTTAVLDDVRRGERALRRRHRWQIGAAATGVAAVGVAGFVMHGSTGTPGSAGSVAGRPGTVGTRTAQAGPAPSPHTCATGCATRRDPNATDPPLTARRIQREERRFMSSDSTLAMLQTYHDVLAEHLDPTGTELRLAQNQQGGGGTFGTKLDWRNGGMLEITVGRSWGAGGSFGGLEPEQLAPITFRGQPARVSTTGTDLVVAVKHDDGVIVSLIASTSFGNNGTSTASLGLTQQQLLEAAADPRLVLPPGL